MSLSKRERINFGKIKEIIPPPNLIQHQIRSFNEFLQHDAPEDKRERVGLEAVFKEFFPIESYDGRCMLDYVSYRVGEEKNSELECLEEGVTYSVPIYLKLALIEEGNAKEEEIYVGEFPMITERSSFIINGAERVVVNQLHRSPGVCFEKSPHTSGKTLYSFRIIPDRGTWIEVQFDPNDLLYVYLDRRRRRRKFLITTLLRAMGYSTDEQILNLFYSIETLSLDSISNHKNVSVYTLTEDVIDAQKGAVLARAFEPLTRTALRSFEKNGIQAIKVIKTNDDDGIIVRCLKKDSSRNEEEALREIHKRLRPGEPVTLTNARAFLRRLFQDPRRYDLGRVGRYKINQKLNLNTDIDFRVVGADDIVAATIYLTQLRKGEGSIDDIDHLGSRHVRSVGELLSNQCRIGLARMERLVKERMALYDQSVDTLTPHKLLNPKVLSTVVRDFFARSQLSQYKDQINLLGELGHTRRLSALGPGGLNRERAGFEVRDVHHSHYGRICPIETPEGQNIGLINALSIYARINEYGFIEAPYRRVEKGRVTDQVDYLNADQEEHYNIAQANSKVDAKGNLISPVTLRRRDEVFEGEPEEAQYMDLSPKQLVSVAAGLIPFLEHDDANRALMGSNMQRQGVPLLQAEAPFVGTGVEQVVARDSRVVIVSHIDGYVSYVDAKMIVVTSELDDTVQKKLHSIKHNPEKGVCVYHLRKFIRSNNGTCLNQTPIIKKGQKVAKGDPIADGSATDQGELALGRNALVAFMPWNGYNFEDAILISERLIKNDVYTSIHIEEFEAIARDTKLGPEEITRDIPNVGEDALRNIGHNGVIAIGSEVKPGDILVGKITPKSETELAPEEKLLRAIFGEKAADVKDSSLVVPSGVYGVVRDVKISSRIDGEGEKLSQSDRRRQIKKVNEQYRSQLDRVKEDLTEALSNILLGEKIPLDVKNSDTGEIIISANRKITKTLLRRLAAVSAYIDIDQSPVRIKIMEIVGAFQSRFSDLEAERDRKIEDLELSEDGGQGTIKSVKVFIATKRKIQVGDKMAGRHGNKGIVSKIVPEEDMPFLPDGTPVDIVLNPLGVPSRMNVGQVLEMHLGWACHKLGIHVATPVFDSIPEDIIWEYFEKANLPKSGKTPLYDGRTGAKFERDVSVGYLYMMKLNHLVADKIHARAVGPYSLITQQPLGGKAQDGGQRFGEMEVWAMEAYGAAYTLLELLTVKSDDVTGRTNMYEKLVKGDSSLEAGTPQSFNVLMKEIQSLCLDMKLNEKDETLSVERLFS